MDTLNQIIWNNRFTKVDKSSVFYENWYRAGIEKLYCLLDENKCQFLTFNGFQRKLQIKCNFLQYYCLLSAIAQHWKDVIKLPHSQESTASTTDIDRLSYKTIYNLLILSKNLPSPTTDSRLTACCFDRDKRRLIYSLPFPVIK